LNAELAATCDASSSSMGTGFLPNKPPPDLPSNRKNETPTAARHETYSPFGHQRAGHSPAAASVFAFSTAAFILLS
jgi:hypothetical protein